MSTFVNPNRKKTISFKYLLSQTLNLMGKIIRNLFIFSSGPIFIRKGRDRYLHGELKDFSDAIHKSLHFDGCEADKRNMHSDIQKLGKDFKKSVREAEEKLHLLNG